MREAELEELATALRERYLLEDVLGQGASGTVFLATDRRHDRRVALKALRPELSGEVQASRFDREIRTSARLQHPHILPLFDSGCAAGRLFYTMPYLPGGTLRDRLRRQGPLPVPEALRLAREMADALGYAHAAGVIHRDLKPENVMLSSTGHALLADFGIARVTAGSGNAEAGDDTATTPGITVGTPAYMSPEQVEGGEIDRRTDVYSLGAVLFEALTGVAPFPAADPVTAMRRRLEQPPPSARALRSEIPPGMDTAIRRAMARDPHQRFATPPAFADALHAAAAQHARRRRWRALLALGGSTLILAGIVVTWVAPWHRPPAAEPMVVVLPFRNLGPPADRYFADGLAEEITSRLAGLSGLRVISRTSADQYRTTMKSLRQIGDELGAEYALEGSVRWDRSGDGRDRIRVNPQLIRVADDTHLWAETYDAELSEVLRIQSNIAEQVTAALDVALRRPERAALAVEATKSPEAYDDYLRGNDYLGRSFEREDLQAALELYQRAVARDSAFAAAWARMSRVHSAMYWFYYDRTEGRLRLARDAADVALRIAPEAPDGRAALGYYYYWGHLDYARALREFEAARRQQPSSSDLLASIGRVDRRRGRWDEAIARLLEAARYDPRSRLRMLELGDTYMSVRRYAEAERYLERTISLAPDWNNPYAYKANLYIVWRGDLAAARAALRQAMSRMELGKLAPAMLSNDRISGAPLTSDSLFQPTLDRLTLATFAGDSVRYHLLKAEAAGFRRLRAVERAYADSARRILEARVRSSPNDARLLAWLGLAYASLDRKTDAIRLGTRAVHVLPISLDANSGPFIASTLARIYLRTGEPDRAIDLLEPLLQIPSWISRAELRADPTWAALHGHPRFRELLQE